MSNITGVYIVRNRVNGKIYIGSASKSIEKRWVIHRSALNKGTHHSRHLQAAWVKYGRVSFDFWVLEECVPDECVDREQMWLDLCQPYNRDVGYNISPTAGSTLGVKLPGLAEKKRGVKRPPSVGLAVSKARAGKPLSLQTKSKISAATAGKPKSDSHRLAISEGKKEWWSNPSNRKAMSEITRSQWAARRSPPTNPMTIYDFGKSLLESGDLDPVYTVLWHSGFDTYNMYKFLIPYWAFYHMGTAAWIAGRPVGYWERFREAAASKDYPRCTERRHYRGVTAIKSVEFLSNVGVFNIMTELGKCDSVKDVRATVEGWYGFGEWISFKVADMLDRLDLVKLAFSPEDALYDSPMASAKSLWEAEGKPDVGANGAHGVWAITRVLEELGDRKAPPRFERPLGPSEAETVLCKYGAYKVGRYHLGEDVRSCYKTLSAFPNCSTARRLLAAGHMGGLW